MNRIFKSEAYLFFIAIILYLFVIKASMPGVIYLIYSSILAVYFFPVKVIYKYKTEKPIPLILSSIVITWFLVSSIIIHFSDTIILLRITIFFMSFVNLFFLYYFYKKKHDNMALHLLAFAFIPMILYG
jgi:hypothetical protein